MMMMINIEALKVALKGAKIKCRCDIIWLEVCAAVVYRRGQFVFLNESGMVLLVLHM